MKLRPLSYNPILDTDSYKLAHFLGYPPGTEHVYSYIESRGGPTDVVFFGLQKLLFERISQPIAGEHIEEAEDFVARHGLPFNKAGWEHILNKHGGYLPLEIKAVPEGLLVPSSNALMTIENLDPVVPWLTSYEETLGLRDIWFASSVASRLFFMRRKLKSLFEMASDNDVSPFSILDFMSRGVPGYDASIIGGMAYLTCFQGSDQPAAVRAANYYYMDPMAGFSVPATEHSIMCAYGRSEEEERAAFHHLVDVMAQPGGIISVVSDTWSIFRAVTLWCEPEMVAKVKAKNLTLVIRPDSGDPAMVLPAILPAIVQAYGGQQNSKGYLVLSNVKVLWGDGIDENTFTRPFLEALKLKIAPDSIMVGSGGGLATVNMTRDLHKWAMKASEMVINGQRVPIMKDPITDPGKASKSGRFALIKNDAGKFETISAARSDVDQADLMETRYRGDGEVIDPTTMAQIRERIEAQL